MKLRILAELLEKTHLRTLLGACLPARGIVGLNYHRIGNGAKHSELDRGLWSATAEAFDQQLAWLKLNADVISPSDIDAVRSGKRGRHVLITFDDGYLDNYEIAFAALRRHKLPATFFISTGFIDDPRLPWWDEIASLVRRSTLPVLELPGWLPEPLELVVGHREAVVRTLLGIYKSLPGENAEQFLSDLRSAAMAREPETEDRLWMSWDMLREMGAAGMTIGGHTVNHVVLAGSTMEQQSTEISTCAERIQAEIGKPMEYFAYPVGNQNSFNEESMACLRRLGVRYAFSYYGGFADNNAPALDMPRMAIEPYINIAWLRAMVEVPRVFCRANPPA